MRGTFRKFLPLVLVFMYLSQPGGVGQVAYTLSENDTVAVRRAPFELAYIGAPLVVTGLAVKSGDAQFRQLRNDYIPAFRWHYDDYTQYLPAVVMVGLKAGGVESRSSWGRMLTSDAFSAVILASAVRSVKAVAKVERPDGSDRRSFPSGHTATAFMTATMLSREYGERSVWYSIGAYSIAAVTGLSRMANNKHWMSDVLAGAGIGIMSTELGYWLADLIFKERGLSYFSGQDDSGGLRNPSFLGLYLGWNLTDASRLPKGDGEVRMTPGRTAGLEGAFFFNPYIGVGGRVSVSDNGLVRNGVPYGQLDLISIFAGAYFSYPILPSMLVGGKLLAGNTHLYALPSGGRPVDFRNAFGAGTGISLTFRVRQHLDMKLFADYDYHIGNTVTLGGCADIAF